MDRTGKASHEATNFDAQVRRKLGEAIRSQYELAGPLPDNLYGLVQQAERCVAQFRDRTELKG
jgi:hypothetical protein